MIYQNEKGELASSQPLVADEVLDNIMRVMSQESFSKSLSARLVGGEKKLEDLISRGKVTLLQAPNDCDHGKWYCNAASVLANCRPFRKPRKKVKRNDLLQEAQETNQVLA